MVKDSILDKLIVSGKIKSFYRSNRWAVIGRDPIRGDGGRYEGPERRRGDLRTKLLGVLDELRNIPLDDAMELFGGLSDGHEDYLLYLLLQAATFERFQRIEIENMYKKSQ